VRKQRTHTGADVPTCTQSGTHTREGGQLGLEFDVFDVSTGLIRCSGRALIRLIACELVVMGFPPLAKR